MLSHCWKKLSTTSYSIIVEKDENGSVIVDRYAREGEIVEITIKPDAAYMLDSIIVTDMNGDTVPITKTGNNTYTFTMPAEDVTIIAEFILIT